MSDALFRVRMRIGETWYEGTIEAPTGGDAAIVLGDRLRAELGDPAGIEEMHVHRIGQEATPQS